MFLSSTYPHRTLCDTLQEMRGITKRLNWRNAGQCKAILESLIEECQTYGNRMEAGLEYGSDIRKLHEERNKLHAEVAALKKALKGDSDADV